jgi:hypothetical protein
VRLIFVVPALIAGASYAGALGAAWTSVIAGALLWMLDFGILHRILRFDPWSCGPLRGDPSWRRCSCTSDSRSFNPRCRARNR